MGGKKRPWGVKIWMPLVQMHLVNKTAFMSCFFYALLRFSFLVFPAVRAHLQHRISCWEVYALVVAAEKAQTKLHAQFPENIQCSYVKAVLFQADENVFHFEII